MAFSFFDFFDFFDSKQRVVRYYYWPSLLYDFSFGIFQAIGCLSSHPGMITLLLGGAHTSKENSCFLFHDDGALLLLLFILFFDDER